MARSATPAAPLPPELHHFIGAHRTFERVRALDQAGFHEAAVAQLHRFLELRPNPAGGIPPDMKPLLQGHSWLHRIRAWVERETDSWKALLTLLWMLLVVVGVFLVAREIWRRVGRLRKPRLSIAKFSGNGDVASGLAEGFSLELQEAVQNVGVEMGGTRPDLTLPPKPAPDELPSSITTAFPQMKFVDALVALIDRLIPSRDRSLSGYLQGSTSAGVGASLALAGDDGRISNQITLRQSEFGPSPTGTQADADDYATLLLPATYWLLAANSGSFDVQPSKWRPRALFAAGARLQEADDLGEARRLYAEAMN
jgi:hypothetical protein